MQTFSLNISYNSSQSQKAQLSFCYPSNSLAQKEKHLNVIKLASGDFCETDQSQNYQMPQVERLSSNNSVFPQQSEHSYFDIDKCLMSSAITSPSQIELDRTLSETPSCTSKMMQNSRKITKESVSRDQLKKNETGSSKKVKWTPEEDNKILKLLAKHGPKWTIIADIMGGRAGKQVRERYLNVLKPGINHREWTEEEDNLFVSLYQRFGKRWCQIAEYLPGRTESQVKNRFYTQSRRQLPQYSAAKNPESLKVNYSKSDSWALISEGGELALDELRSKSLSSPSLSKESSIDSFFGFDIEEDPYFSKICESFNHDEIRWN